MQNTMGKRNMNRDTPGTAATTVETCKKKHKPFIVYIYRQQNHGIKYLSAMRAQARSVRGGPQPHNATKHTHSRLNVGLADLGNDDGGCRLR